MEKLMPQDEELYKRIDEFVHYIWDPIGIREIPQARDEYNSYLAAIFSRVKAGNADEIVEYMKSAAEENMGLSFDQEKAKKIACVLLEWKRVTDERT